MTIAALLIALVIIGVAMALLPMEQTVRRLILVIVVVVALVWLLSALGILPAVRFR
jgi:hypothetical protein